MPVQEEKCFPRGGKEQPKEKPKKSPHTLKRKRISDAPSPVTTEKKPKLKEKIIVHEISLQSLSEGMIMLGCVREITSLEIKINLPGLIVGYVPATNISEEYSAHLKEVLSGEEKEPQDLSDMFTPGQLVVTRVEEISTIKEKKRVILSLIPKIIQGDLSVGDVMKGFMLSASVQSNEDRVYVMNCGIPGVRALLKKSEAVNYQNTWNNEKPLGVGQVLRCLITKCTTSEGTSNVELTVDPEKLSEPFLAKGDVPLNSIILGRSFQLSVKKIVSSGLLVNLTSDQTGYIHLNHLKANFRNMEKNSMLQGRVLYIEPLTRNVFLSALENVGGPHPRPLPFVEFQKGTKFSKAKVITVKGGNVLLELKNNSDTYGLVSFHQLDIDENIGIDKSHYSIVKEKYPPESCHKCKILEYDYMTQKFICTLKSSIIKQKYTSVDELTPGVVEECIVLKSSLRSGITLSLCGIKGIVEPIHCTDEPVRYPDTLFKKGQRVMAKVLAVKNPICEFTLKPSLVNSKKSILTKFSDAIHGEKYDGVIVSVARKGVLVKFYGDFKVFVPANHVLDGKNLETLYNVGQLVTCNVTNVCDEEKKLTLNVQPYEEKSKSRKRKCPLKIGEPYTAIVQEINPEGLVVKVNGIMGRIPTAQLTDNPQISLLLCQSYSEGDQLQAFFYSDDGNEILFTASPTFMKYLMSPSGKKQFKKGITGLEEGMVLPSMVVEISSEELILSLPMLGEKCTVSVSCYDVGRGTVKDIESLGIHKHQTLMVKIKRIFENSICGSCNLESVCDRAVMSESGLALLKDFMNSSKRIRTFWKNSGHPLGELEIGSQVEGTVVAVTSLGAVVDLDNNARAVVMPIHIDKEANLKVDMRVKGTVMYLDIVNECVEITLLKHITNRFSSVGKVLDVGLHKQGFVFISRPDILVVGIKHFTTHYITYVPSRWHINDLHPSPLFPVGVRESMTIRECEDDLIFAVPRKVELHERRCRSEKERIDLFAHGTDDESDNAKNDAPDNSFLSLIVKTEVKKESDDKDEMSEGSIKSEICSEDDMEESISNRPMSKNESTINSKHTENCMLKKSPSFEESLNFDESIEFSQLQENLSEPLVDNCEKVKQKKKKKKRSNSLEKSVNDIEMMEESTISLSNEKVPDVEIRSKKQKKKPGIDKSLSLNESFDKSQFDEENLEDGSIIENKKPKNKVNESQKRTVLVNENDVPFSSTKIEETDNNTYPPGMTQSGRKEELMVESKSKKQKKSNSDDRTLSQPVEKNFSEPLKENQNQIEEIKKKKKNSLKKSINETEMLKESIVTKNDEKDCSKNVIKEIFNNSQTASANESFHTNHEREIRNKKQKKKSGKDQSWMVENWNDSSNFVEENLSESLKDNNENEPQIKKQKKKKTENSLLNQQDGGGIIEKSTGLVNKEALSQSSCEENSKNPQGNKKNTIGGNIVGKKIKSEKGEENSKNPQGNEKNTIGGNIVGKKIKSEKGEENSKNPQGNKKNTIGGNIVAKKIKSEKGEKDSTLDNKENKKSREQGSSEKLTATLQASYLDVSAGFFWNATPDQLPAVNKQKTADTDSSSEDETEVTMNKKKKQRLTIAEKRELARQEEERLRKVEERLMDAERNPVSADDFDRLVMSAPNDSRNWIKYMAYHLEATEVGKARAVAERALKTISFREEQEKLNVWMALLSLENMFGTQESFDKTLEEAVKMNDSYKVHMQVLNMFSSTKKLEELDKIVQLVTKKYKNQTNTWIEAGLACIKCGEIQKSRQLMQRALKILDKKHHTEILTRFARMENEWGESERAETLMENILTSYPKRTDVWIVYIDMLVKSKKFDIARQVLDRAVIQKLPATKMKMLFQKYLTFEQAHGTPDKVEKVREMARNFIVNMQSDVS